MFEKYFQDTGVKPGFEKEFVSLFDGWLGTENLHKLDEVTEVEWARSNSLLRQIQQNHRLYIVDLEACVCREINDIDSITGSHKDSMDKEYAQFTKIVIPELDAVYTEEWDYTWILWHKNNGAVEALSSLIMGAGLFHWRDACTQNSN